MSVESTTTTRERGAAKVHRTVCIAPLVAPFAVMGVVEAALTLAGARSQLDLWLLASLLSIMGLWLVAGLVLASFEHLLARAALGRDGLATVAPRAAQRFGEVWREPDRERDRRRAATLLASLFACLIVAALSVALLVYLIKHRNGPLLIAATFIVGQLGALALAVLPAVALRRLLLARDLRLLTVRHVVSASVVVCLVAIVSVAARSRDVLGELDAVSYALLFLALLTGPLLLTRPPRFLSPRRLPLIAAAVALPLMMIPLQAAPVRDVVSKQSFTAKRYLSVMQSLSDVDRDGSPALPYLADCSPLDAKVHPLARELPGNGVDENCDELDSVSGGGGEATARFGPLKRPGPKPNLVLITIDSLRADHVGAFGYKRHPTSPNLDALAAASVRFSSAFSQDSGTVPSMWSLMVGKTPFQTRLEKKERFPPNYAESEVTLAERLTAGGYQTSAVLCGSYFARAYWNLKDGFEDWREVCGKEQALVAPRVTEAALDALDDLPDDEPFFLWVHYFDPHKPYTDHEDLAFGASTVDRYDEEIAYTDRNLVPLLERLKARTGRPTYIAVSADHGENFGEHGRAPHARTLYREVTHVPLLLHGPDVKAREVKAPVALGDLFPTFIDLAGLPVPSTTTMVSQGHVLFGAAPDRARLVFQENSWSRPLRHMKGVVSQKHHMLLDLTNNSVELYDRKKDPKERRNLYGKSVAEEAELERKLRDFSATTELPVWMR